MTNSEFIPPHPLNTAVLFLVFNRPDTTKQVFEAIRKAKPPRLYVAADGPRADRPGEDEKVREVRDYVLKNIDWDCEIKTLFREKNLGCKYAVSGAITWFFENEEMGIILEDDCLPSQSFFWFCEALLAKYKCDINISMITGTSYLFNELDSENGYFFSKNMSIWGWATWRSRWLKYDLSMELFPVVKQNKQLDNYFHFDPYISELMITNIEKVYHNQIDTWDYQWVFACAVENVLCITPYKNLISNIGIEGTRNGINSPFIKMERVELPANKILKGEKLTPIHSLSIDRILFNNVFYRFGKYKHLKKMLAKIKLLNIIRKVKGYLL